MVDRIDKNFNRYFFTADEHYGHHNVIYNCKRPFSNVSEMDNFLINCHNSIVPDNGITYHLGDFTLKNKNFAESIIKKLNGKHIFIKGSHDKWLSSDVYIKELKIDNKFIVLCHYAMRRWARSHYNSWNLYGHSHGRLDSIGKTHDVGVDTNNFYPYSFKSICYLMDNKPNNVNLIFKEMK